MTDPPDPASSISQRIDDGRAHYQAGRLDKAESLFRGVLEVQPDNAEALYLMGIIAHQQGSVNAAIDWLGRAVACESGNATYLSNLGAAYLGAQRMGDALVSLEKAVRIDPEAPDILNILGEAYRMSGRFDDAAAVFRRAIDVAPGHAEAHGNLAVALLQAGRPDEALMSAEAAVAADAAYPEGYNTLGAALRAKGRLPEAVTAFRRALELAPDLAEARHNLSRALLPTQRAEEAVRRFRKAMDTHPGDGAAYAGMARALLLQGRVAESLPLHRRAVELSPENALFHSNLLFGLQCSAEIDTASLYEEHRRWNARHAMNLCPPEILHGNERNEDRRLRLGYVSADFSGHPVGRLALPVLTAHDRGGFEVLCYSQTRSEDGVTARFRAACDRWNEVTALSDQALADAIRADGVDILIDLTGHTANNRLLAFARKPAPVQMTWLGYPGTTGLDTMDYVIGDPVHAPDGFEDQFSERILRLPHDLLCFEPPDDAPDVGPLPAGGRDHITFGVFNHPRKISAPALALWTRLLKELPDARLIMKYNAYDDLAIRENMLSRFTESGVEAGRLEIIGGTSYRDTLNTCNRVDIALDSFPYSGTMTTLESLWMGAPVVTLAGDRMAARSTAAHLEAVGLAELVAHDEAGYLSIARSLAGDRARLAEIRANMRDRLRSSPLCDVAGFVHDLEALYREAWRRWCAG